MNFLSTPVGYDLFGENKYCDFGDFKLFITKRNWVGNTYVGEEEGNKYLKEIKEITSSKAYIKSKNFEKWRTTSPITGLSLIVDSSVLKTKDEFSETILEFLEELEDVNENSEKKIQIRYQKKLKNYAGKLENYPYLLRWYSNNENHIFAKDVENIVMDVTMLKMNKIIKSLIKDHKSPSAWDKTTIEYHKCYAQIFKYVFNEPSLILSAVQSVYLLYSSYKKSAENITGQVGKLLIEKDVVLYLNKANHKIECIEYIISNENNDRFIRCETHIKQYNKEARRVKYVSETLELIGEVCKPNSAEIEVLKEITNWAAKRIQRADTKKDITNWYHEVSLDYFKEFGIDRIRFISEDIVAGPMGQELSIYVSSIYTKENECQKVSFPILDTGSWNGLNAHQCALMAYAVCLYHDFLMNENYTLLPANEGDTGIVLGGESKLVFESEIETSNDESSAVKSRTNKAFKSRTKMVKKNQTKQHWVNFHFRKLHEGYSASESAKITARKYGFKNIPKGYTFVDIHVKGNGGEDVSEIKISALDVISKTLSKVKETKNINMMN